MFSCTWHSDYFSCTRHSEFSCEILWVLWNCPIFICLIGQTSNLCLSNWTNVQLKKYSNRNIFLKIIPIGILRKWYKGWIEVIYKLIYWLGLVILVILVILGRKKRGCFWSKYNGVMNVMHLCTSADTRTYTPDEGMNVLWTSYSWVDRYVFLF